ncbi:perlucin-like protein [Patiria miniata]|uniref:C-type lectin n=1 Tax=Patiria miniata TaxID=46514 RepID=A0A913ZBD9_PATMI|nr:perlucin-like protein [Patiria miniata]
MMAGCTFLVGLVLAVFVGRASCLSCGDTSGGICPPGWQNWGESCFAITTYSLNWYDSADRCRQLGGKLAAPRSAEENAFVSGLIGPQHAWIACNDLEEEGKWLCDENRWYRNWQGGQPDDDLQRQDCAHMIRYSGQWGDDYCPYYRLVAVCKRRVAVNSRLLRSWRLLSACLIGHVLSEYPISSLDHCAWLCSQDPGCRSFNVVHRGYGEKLCQLNSATRHDVDSPQFHVGKKGVCIYGEK